MYMVKYVFVWVRGVVFTHTHTHPYAHTHITHTTIDTHTHTHTHTPIDTHTYTSFSLDSAWSASSQESMDDFLWMMIFSSFKFYRNFCDRGITLL